MRPKIQRFAYRWCTRDAYINIQVREGVRVWDMEKRAHHNLLVYYIKFNVVPMRRGGFKQCLRGSCASSPSTLLFV